MTRAPWREDSPAIEPPVVRFYPADLAIPPQLSVEEQQKLWAEIRDIAVAAVGEPVRVRVRSSDGSEVAFASWPEPGDDPELAELLAVARLPLDLDVVDVPVRDPSREAEVAKLAARDARDRLVEKRWVDAEALFAAADDRLVARARTRRELRSLIASGRLRCRARLAERLR